MNLILELLNLKDEIGNLKRMMFSYAENHKVSDEDIKLQREMELQEEIEKIRIDALNEHIFTGYKLNLQEVEFSRIKEVISKHPKTLEVIGYVRPMNWVIQLTNIIKS